MTLVEIVGWCGTLFQLIGLYFNIKKKTICWLFWIISNALWCVYGFHKPAYSVIALNIAFFIFNLYGLKTWKKDEK